MRVAAAALPCPQRIALAERGAEMPKVRVTYDGWIALPVAVRQKLRLSTGDQLGLELSGETITLRRSAPATASPAPEPAAAPAAEGSPSEPSAVAQPEPTARRGPGR